MSRRRRSPEHDARASLREPSQARSMTAARPPDRAGLKMAATVPSRLPHRALSDGAMKFDVELFAKGATFERVGGQVERAAFHASGSCISISTMTAAAAATRSTRLLSGRDGRERA